MHDTEAGHKQNLEEVAEVDVLGALVLRVQRSRVASADQLIVLVPDNVLVLLLCVVLTGHVLFRIVDVSHICKFALYTLLNLFIINC